MHHVVAKGLKVPSPAVGPSVCISAGVLQSTIVRFSFIWLLGKVESKGITVLAGQTKVDQENIIFTVLIQANQKVLSFNIIVCIALFMDELECLDNHHSHSQYSGQGQRGFPAFEPFVQITEKTDCL